MTEPRYKGEALLLSWGDNKSGRKIVLQLEKDGPGSHPFDGLDGERFAVVIVGPLASAEHTEIQTADGLGNKHTLNLIMGDGAYREKDASPGEVTSGVSGAPAVQNKSPAKHKPTKWADMKPAARAALLCKDPEFWGYLSAMAMDGLNHHEASATAELKTRCGVESRAEIVEGSRAAAELSRIIGNFNAWRQAKELGHDV